MESADGVQIGVASESQRRDAIELVLRPLAAEARAPLLDSLAASPPQALGPLDALIVGSERGRVVAATWAQPSPGNAAALWPPEWVGKKPLGATPTEDRLIRRAVEVCDATGVAMTQVLLESAEDQRAAALSATGFARVAVLEYLGCSVPRVVEPSNPSDLTFEPYRPEMHQRLKRLLEATYVDSLDCPALGQVRDLDDVLAGYRAIGRYDPDRWLIAVGEDGTDLGVLLMAEHPDADQTELIYLGAPPNARGRGVGRQLVDRALLEASRIGSDHLMVAVDQANTPARQIYERAGFARWATRHVYVRLRDGRSRTVS